MLLNITDQTTILQIKDQFSLAFPGLTMEFVLNPHGEGEGSRRVEIMQGNRSIRELNGEGMDVQIEIKPEHSIAHVEALFRDHLGLNVQVFRKAGLNWIETVNTDHWTIAEQMESVR